MKFITARNIQREIFFILSLAIILGFTASLSSAQNIQSDPGTITPQYINLRQEILDKRKNLEDEIKAAKEALRLATKRNDVKFIELLSKETELLQRLEMIYTQQLSAIDYESELTTIHTQIKQELETLLSRGLPATQSYSFSTLESTRDELYAQMNRSQDLNSVLQSAQDALNEATATYEEKERTRRKAKELFENNKNTDTAPELKASLRIAQLESLVSKAQEQLRKIELSNQKTENRIHHLRLTLLQKKIDLLTKNVQFQKDDLSKILNRLDEKEFHISQLLERAKIELSSLDTMLMNARQRLDQSLDKDQVLTEEVEARQTARQAKQREVALLGKQLQYITEARIAWNRRFEIFHKMVKTQKLKEWEQVTRKLLTQLQRESHLHISRLSDLRKEITLLDDTIKKHAPESHEIVKWFYEQKRYIEQLIRTYETSNTLLGEVLVLHEKLLAEISTQIKTITFGERLEAFWDIVKKVWRYELTTIDDHAITVSKVIIALFFAVLGFIFSRYFSNFFIRQLLLRFHVPEPVIAAFQAITFYIMVLFFVFFALRIVNLPLTIFTVLGGAFAIGVGFGSQNLFNNFISGLIIFAERPIKIGDLIDIEGVYGIVEHIGMRSTKIRSTQNTHVIVPNSSFLQKNVLNWTHTDNLVRTSIKVGVIYGSPTREVERLLRKAIDEHNRVVKKPEPILLFTDFGNSSLNFEAHFWIRIKTMMDRLVIESDLRYHIDNLFREAGIVIAFPQRDVHFYNPKPIEVHVVNNQEKNNP